MSCDMELVSAFLDGELDRVILGTVTNHLLRCDHCCRTMGRLAAVRDALAEKFALCYPEELTQSVMSAISNEKIAPVQSRLRRRLLKFGVPAVVVASLLSGGTTAKAGGHLDRALEATRMADISG